MLNHTRRLSPEEIKASLPKILTAQARKEDKRAVSKAVAEHKAGSMHRKVSVSLGDTFRTAYANGHRVRGARGRFLALPKAA